MITIHKSIHIDKPVKEVFDFISDFSNDILWRKDAAKAGSLPAGVIRKGTISSETFFLFDKKIIVPVVITEFIPDIKITYLSTAPILEAEFVRIAENENSGTSFTYALKAELTGLPMVAPVIAAESLGKRIEDDLENLRHFFSNK